MRGWTDPYLWAILIVSALLLFGRLDGRCLWQDEAETALLARSVIRNGLPLAHDGKNLISQEMGRDSDPKLSYLWRWSSWLPIYLAAAPIALLGPTTLAPRLPSAFFGWLTVVAVYGLARRMFDSVWLARLASALLALSPSFLLHARQARWYSLAGLLVVVLVWALIRLREGRRFGVLGVALTATALFHANYLIALGMAPAGLLAAGMCFPQRRHLLGLLAAAALTAVLCVHGLWFFQAFSKPGSLAVYEVATNFTWYLRTFVTFLLPLPALVILGWALFRHRAVQGLSVDWPRSAIFWLLLLGLFICYLSLAPWVAFRYLSVLLPGGCILLALTAVWLWRLRPALGVVFLVVLVSSDVLHRMPLAWFDLPELQARDRFPAVGPVASPLAGFLYEWLQPPTDPECVLADYLREHGRAEETLLISYGDLPLQYYTDLRVVGGLQSLPLPHQPDWIVVRQPGAVTDRPGGDADVIRFVQRQVRLGDYEAITLGCPDLLLAANPEPLRHRYRVEPDEASPVVLYRRRRSGD